MSICQFCTQFVNRHADEFVFICIYLPLIYLFHFYQNTDENNVQFNLYYYNIYITVVFFLPTRNKLSYLKNKV